MLLLERSGEVVTRDELSKRLWPSNTFVDFERGLNKAINKLRAALRDNAEKPCLIETLPQRGYRFIAAVENLTQARGRFRPQNAPPIDSLAVLPLDNLSGDSNQEFFSDGLTEELICAVARITSLRVISRTSVMAYKRSQKSLPVIAKELSVDAVVEGSIARSGRTVRITVQLILATEDRHLWSGRYERDLGDVLQLQAEVAQSIANQINKLVDPEHAYPEHARQVHPQAYEECLKGNFFRDKMTPDDLEKSIGSSGVQLPSIPPTPELTETSLGLIFISDFSEWSLLEKCFRRQRRMPRRLWNSMRQLLPLTMLWRLFIFLTTGTGQLLKRSPRGPWS